MILTEATAMATSSIGRTTVVTQEYGEALAKAVREYKARHANDRRPVSLTSIAEVRPIGEHARPRGWH